MNGIILINKPAGYTSHDIVHIVKKTLQTRKVGHAGTLDPDATGVLVVCVNKATKVLQFLTADTKEYIATLKLGTSTDTYDASGEVLESKEVTLPLDMNVVKKVLESFLGKQKQVPPIYSAIKVNGKKAYEYARNGEELKLEARDIEILDIELLGICNDEIQFRVICSKGTYIRSLCKDIASALGYPGHMQYLIRSQSGDFSINQCCSLEQVKAGEFEVLSIEQALASYPKYVIEDENIVFHGKKIKSNSNEVTVVYNKEGTALAMYGPDGFGYLKNIRGLW